MKIFNPKKFKLLRGDFPKIILTICFIIILLSCLFKKQNTENFYNQLNIENADDKMNEILSNTDDHSEDNLIKLSHEWCANMRNSKSLSTACLPLSDKDGNNKKHFVISVCCSTCYCQILKVNGSFHYHHDDNNNLHYLMKNDKVVQVIRGFDNRDDCIKEAKNEDLYFPYLKLSVIKNKICKK